MSSTCVQAGVVRPLGGYQQHLMQAGSPEAGWRFNPSVVPKQEPMEEERNDSGINSDCPSSSPGSDRIDNPHLSSPQTHQPLNEATYTSTPTTQVPYDTWYKNNFINGPLEHKDVQPQLESTIRSISAVPMASPKRKDSTDSRSVNENSQDYQPSPSPRQDSSGDEANSEFDDQGIRIPKVNSHGKIKIHKCKQCDFVAYTKLDFWNHSANHIKGDKALKCTKCPFVTEYKHHLEYHLLNHAGAKPFKCDHCDYSCVNKSMLNSHLKSHSKVYQYRCSDCLYETKYCHSLKLHLRKYNHKPAMVLNPDGTPNPLPIIDVYGTRRGPKVKKQHSSQPDVPAAPAIQGQPIMPPFNPLPHFMGQMPGQMPFPFPIPPNSEIIRMLQERLHDLAKQSQVAATQNENAALDLSKNGHSSDEEDDATTTMFSNVEVVDDRHNSADNTLTEMGGEARDTGEAADASNNNNDKMVFECQYCSISFGEEVLFRIHMGYHGYSNPFTCNMCGEECKDKVSFFLHIARAAH